MFTDFDEPGFRQRDLNHIKAAKLIVKQNLNRHTTRQTNPNRIDHLWPAETGDSGIPIFPIEWIREWDLPGDFKINHELERLQKELIRYPSIPSELYETFTGYPLDKWNKQNTAIQLLPSSITQHRPVYIINVGITPQHSELRLVKFAIRVSRGPLPALVGVFNDRTSTWSHFKLVGTWTAPMDTTDRPYQGTFMGCKPPLIRGPDDTYRVYRPMTPEDCTDRVDQYGRPIGFYDGALFRPS